MKFEFFDIIERREKYDQLQKEISNATDFFELQHSDCVIQIKKPVLRVDRDYIPITSEEHEKLFLEVVDSE